MLKSIEAKKGNPVIFFYLPKPIQSEEPPTLSMMEYEELHMAQEHDGGMKSQINMLRHGYTAERQKLEDKYPVSNNPLFPGKHIYASKDKTFWELTPICIEVWAAAIAKSRATYNTPPTSTHFIASNTIKPCRPEPGAPLSTFAACHKFVSGTDEAQSPVVGPGVDSEIPTYHPHPTIFPVADPTPYSMQPLVYPTKHPAFPLCPHRHAIFPALVLSSFSIPDAPPGSNTKHCTRPS
ncbi:hypothetical protein PAXINDRAFT_9312 [Paxillus involutus ATCC 200175]|nr:hypothetical protein PAXINDRAFT_9312 [Paxillus involutus ATCC 200175]